MNAFYEAAFKVAPGAWELLQDLLASWTPYALQHCWKMPDGFDVKVKVMQKIEAPDPRCRIEVDELDHATFTYEFYENVGSKFGLSNVANVVHSVDAYILRSIQRRCNYDYDMVINAATLIDSEIITRAFNVTPMPTDVNSQVKYYAEQYQRSNMVDVVILPYLTCEDIRYLTTEHLKALIEVINGMLEYKPFPVVTIHDDFKCHANNLNYLRQQYINVLAELADSNVMSDLMSQLLGYKVTYKKLSTNLSSLIRQSNYGLS